MVKDFKMFSDPGLTIAITNYEELISSGFNTDKTEAEVGPQLAVDDDMSTAWRPQGGTGVSSANYPAADVWIGMKFAAPTTVKGATAVGLGIGDLAGKSWNGGIILQSSNDGDDWTTVARSDNSDSVKVEEANTQPAESDKPSCILHEGTVHVVCGSNFVRAWGIGPEGQEQAIKNCNWAQRNRKCSEPTNYYDQAWCNTHCSSGVNDDECLASRCFCSAA